jgi:hypothetical protein
LKFFFHFLNNNTLLFIKLFETSKLKSKTFSSFTKIAQLFIASLDSLLLFASQAFTIVSNKFSQEYLNHHIAVDIAFIPQSSKVFITSILSTSSQNIKFDICLHNSASFVP